MDWEHSTPLIMLVVCVYGAEKSRRNREKYKRLKKKNHRTSSPINESSAW